MKLFLWSIIFVCSSIFPSISNPLNNTVQMIRRQVETLANIVPGIPYDGLEMIDVPFIGHSIVEEYDFIIVGAGSAGSALANRLSEVRDWKILLLEAGVEGDFLTDIPEFAVVQQFYWHNWGYVTEREENLYSGLVDRRTSWPRGKGLGGSSLINMMVFTRGNPIDYDRWAAMGNKGWSHEDVLPYFVGFEDAQIRYKDKEFRGTHGEVTVQDASYRTKSAHAFIEAGQEVGHSYVDYNGRKQIGISYVQATTRRGLRCSGEKAFLRPAKRRNNLKIRPLSFVTKVLIHDGVAKGVEYIRNGMTHTVKASKEVILSAGAINSPQLLILSGIGPEEELQRLRIPLVKNLPVGKNLVDHVSFPGLSIKVNAKISFQTLLTLNPLSFGELYLNGTGPLSCLGTVEAISFLKTPASKDPDPNYPDVELIFSSSQVQDDITGFTRASMRISDKVYNTVFKPLKGLNVLAVFPTVLHPKSRGYLKLRSRDPYHHPILRGNYYTDSKNEDMKTMIAAIREAQKIFKAPTFQKYEAEIVTTKIPGCEDHEFDSDAYWECAVRAIPISLFHQMGTCKMGPNVDQEAVVDDQMQVYGIENLRVIDASVIPLPISGHTNVPSFMIGAKGADLIKNKWSQRFRP